MAVCLLGVVGILLARQAPNVREGVSLTHAVVNFVLVLWMYTRFIKAGETIECTLFSTSWTRPVEIAFRVDDLGILFALVASGLWIVNTLYSIGYMRAHNEHKQTRFYCLLRHRHRRLHGGGVRQANLLSMFAFYELLTICTYPLVIHAETDDGQGRREALRHLPARRVGRLPAARAVPPLACEAGTSPTSSPGGLLRFRGTSGCARAASA